MQPDNNLPPPTDTGLPAPAVLPPQMPPQTQQPVNEQASDKLVTVVHRHFFGIFIIYVQTVLALAVGIGLIYFLLPNFVDPSQEEVYRIVGIAAAAIVIIMAIIMVIATIIYYSSKIVVTERHITQILQVGLFHRKVSQLAVNNVEDVTATKQGIFSTILNFGVLKIETAGEQVNFIFNYCPRPDFYARQILNAREHMRGHSQPDDNA